MRKYSKDMLLHIKHMARWAVNRAVASGQLLPLPCALCGSLKAEGHHSDYSKPLTVVWLCRSCHEQEHAKAEGRAQ